MELKSQIIRTPGCLTDSSQTLRFSLQAHIVAAIACLPEKSARDATYGTLENDVRDDAWGKGTVERETNLVSRIEEPRTDGNSGCLSPAFTQMPDHGERWSSYRVWMWRNSP